jgi:hypothetical protein
VALADRLASANSGHAGSAVRQSRGDRAGARELLGIHADALAQFLVSRGHARHTIKCYLNALEHLGLIFPALGLPFAIASESDAREAMRAHSVGCCSGPRSSRRLMTATIPHLWAVLRERGIVKPPRPKAMTPVDSFLAAFGKYLIDVRGIDRTLSERYRKVIAQGLLGAKPGWVRFSLPYYASDEDVEFILRAVEFVADHGESFVPIYRLGWKDGVWSHSEKPMRDVVPLQLTTEALLDAGQSFAS